MTSQYRSLLSLLTVCLAGGSLMAAAPDREDVERRVKPSAASFRREMTKELSRSASLKKAQARANAWRSARLQGSGPRALSYRGEASSQRIQLASERLGMLRGDLNLGSESGFEAISSHVDELGMSHVRFQQFYKGLPVWLGEAVMHLGADGEFQEPTLSTYGLVSVDVRPGLSSSEALAAVSSDLRAKGDFAHEPKVELVVYPITQDVVKGSGVAVPKHDPGAAAVAGYGGWSTWMTHWKYMYGGYGGYGGPRKADLKQLGKTDLDFFPHDLKASDIESRVERYALAYHVHVELDNPGEVAQVDYMVDAHTGVLLKKWNAMKSVGAQGWGRSQYTGWVPVPTNLTRNAYEVRDLDRGHGGLFQNNVVTNMDLKSRGPGSVYADYHSDFNNMWGDTFPFVPGLFSPPKSWPVGDPAISRTENARTAAMDAAFGQAFGWDYFGQVFGRNGIDGKGKGTYAKVHFNDRDVYPAPTPPFPWNWSMTNHPNPNFPDLATVNGIWGFFGPAFPDVEAYWSDSCFCVTYSEGPFYGEYYSNLPGGPIGMTPLSPDIVTHEMTHGVLGRTARLTETGEAAGLGEAVADIHGAVMSFWLYLAPTGEGQDKIADVKDTILCWNGSELTLGDGFAIPDFYGNPVMYNGYNWYPYTIGGQTNSWYPSEIDPNEPSVPYAWWDNFSYYPGTYGPFNAKWAPGYSAPYRDLANPLNDYDGFGNYLFSFWGYVQTFEPNPPPFPDAPAWFPNIGSYDPHFACGPMNYCFYLIANGDYWTPAGFGGMALGYGMPNPMFTFPYPNSGPCPPMGYWWGGWNGFSRMPEGMGNDKAVKILWRAVNSYMTPRSTYLDAKNAMLRATKDLYGAWSAEYQHVFECFDAINVK